MPVKMTRHAFLFSGGGSTMEQIINDSRNGLLKGLVDPVVAIASKDDAGGIMRALSAGLTTDQIVVCRREDYRSNLEYGEALLRIFYDHGVESYGQYGWTRLTPPNVVDAYWGRGINQHPELLDHGFPGFGGTGMVGLAAHDARIRFLHETAKSERDWWTGVVAHWVWKGFDEGPVIKMIKVPVYPDDTAESLQERGLPYEWQCQILALRDYTTNNVRELVLPTRLVQPGQEAILKHCKAEAIKKYPFHN